MERSPQLPKKPDARTEKVEDLVDMVYRGLVRVPTFQRALRWEAKHVQELFDSIYRGYPIGSLLFYQRPASAARIPVGPLQVAAPETDKAWWVVDGQQRLVALTASLKRSVPLPSHPDKKDPYVLYFDIQGQVFQTPQRSGEVPATWVPLPNLLDAAELSEWAFGWKHARDETLRRRLFEAGARIREYPVPLYIIETADLEPAKQIFYRTNHAGKPLDWPTVYKALFGSEDARPSTLGDLSTDLAEVGMGGPSEHRLLTALFGLRGLDPTRPLDDHLRRDPDAMRDAVREALPVLRRVLSFLRQDAEIPHLRLLPKPILLDVLARFFVLHESPSARSRMLLSRWFWRAVLGAGVVDDRTLRRRGIKSIEADDEEGSVQRLLSLVDRSRQRPFELPPAFDGRSDDNRVILCTLAHLRPRNLETGQPLDVASLLEEIGEKAFAKIVKHTGVPGARSPANRILQAKGVWVMKHLRQQDSSLLDGSSVAASHAISPDNLDLLIRGELADFLKARAEMLTNVVRDFAGRMAAWEHSDRPSIDYLLRQTRAVAT